jgi:hypothetical protein
MILIILTFLAAFLLSGIAAYYSVIGLALIFAGAFWPVIIMGSTLEFAKLITASWLYNNWQKTNILLKSYLTAAVVILMFITSMGIFGFLAKSHIDSTLESGANTVELKTLSQQQKIAEQRLEYLLKRAGNPETASASIDRQIQSTQKELTEINKKRLPFLKEENKLVADVGPIKYVADVFFGAGDGALDKAVRLVIFMIMLVFDPLAVLLLIAGNISYREKYGNKISIPVSVPKPIKRGRKTIQAVKESANNTVEIPKENLVTIEEDVATTTKKRGFPRRQADRISKYDESAELAFKEKKDDGLDGGNF